MRKWRILAVDDDPDVCVAIRVILRDKYEVVTENSGRAALEWLDVIEPDFIILDVRMPDLDGYAVCHRIRSDNQFRDTPILFLSVLDSPEDVRKAYEVGANLYLAKPFDPIRLLKNIDVFVERTPPVFRKKRYELEELAVVTAYLGEGEAPREEQVAHAAPSRAPRRPAARPPAESRPPLETPPLVTRADEITFITEPEEIEEEELEPAPSAYESPVSRRTPRRREPVQETPAEEERIEEPPAAIPFRELRPAKRRAAKPATAETSAPEPGSLGPGSLERRRAAQTPIERTAARVERRIGPRERRIPSTAPAAPALSAPSISSSASAPSTPFPPSAPFSPFPPPPQPPSREGRRPRVLFVLDDSDELAQLAGACEDKFEFVWSDNSLTAFENLALYEPDILFIDAAGPNINGFELGRAIRAHLGFKNTPIVFYSSDSSFRQRQMAKRAGASDFLKRPAAPGQVTAMLERQLAASKTKIRRKKNTIEQVLDLIEFGPSTSGPDEAI